MLSSSPQYSTLLLLLGRLAARRLASNRLLPVLLAAAQQLQVTGPASQSLLCHGLQTRGVLLVDGVGANEDGLLGLDDLVSGLDALRTTRPKDCQYYCAGCLSVVEELGTYGLAGIFFSVLAFLSCA